MTILARPLVLLSLLRLRAMLRLAWRTLRTPKGALLTIVGCLVLGLAIVPLVVSRVMGASVDPDVLRAQVDQLRLLVPFAMLGLMVLTIVRTGNDQALVFHQAEVDFLFPAPCSRRQLLLYKLSQRVLSLAIAATFFVLWSASVTASLAASWLGAFLGLWFIHLSALCLALLATNARSSRQRWLRRLVGGAIVVAIGVGVAREFVGKDSTTFFQAMKDFAQSPLGALLAVPVRPFVDLFFSSNLVGDGFPRLLMACAINGGLLLLAMRLDSHWLEAGAESSKKIAAKVEEMRRTGGFGGGAVVRGFRVPMLPRWGGVGPLMWRQATAGVRQGLRALFIVLLMSAGILLPRLFASGDDSSKVSPLAPIGAVLLGYTSLFLPQILRLDFRADIDRMDVLKALPVHPIVVTLGQILMPALIVSSVQVPVVLGLTYLGIWMIPAPLAWIPALCLVNVVIAALDNAAFLLWPTRPSRGVGMQFAMSQMVGHMVKMLVLFLLVGSAVGATAATYVMTGHQAVLAALVAIIVLGIECAILLAVVTHLFARFDPSAEQVPDA